MKENGFKKLIAILIAATVSALAFVLVGTLSDSTFLTAVAYAILAFCAAVYGPAAGALAGLVGGVFTLPGIDMTTLVNAGCSGLLGLAMGLLTRRYTLYDGVFSKHDAIGFNLWQGFSHLIVWGLVSPVLNWLIFSRPFADAFKSGVIMAAIYLAVTAIVGTLLLFIYAAVKPKKGSLKKK